MNLWRRFVIGSAQAATWLARTFGAGGTALPGLIVERLSPNLLGVLATQLPQGVIVVTGTNGKTTTAKILRQLLEARGLSVLANRSGSNFTRGIIASFVQHTGLDGRIRHDIAVLEIDEAYVPHLAEQLKPRQLIALNVMRDQLDRYGEIDHTAQMIGAGLEYCQAAVLNADDPPVAALSKLVGSDIDIDFFGAAAHIRKLLPSDEELMGKTMKVNSDRPRPDTLLKSIKGGEDTNSITIKVKNQEFTTDFSLEGVHNALNATAAIAGVNQLFGLNASDVDQLSHVKPAFGRGERLRIEGVPVHLALIKNPAGFNQNVRSFVKPHVGLFLVAINDKYADGRDVSWLWDVDLTPLPAEGKYIVSGIRAYDMALRLQYEGITDVKIEPNLSRALKAAIAATPEGKELLILPTYTAMLDIRKRLSKKVEAHEIWR